MLFPAHAGVIPESGVFIGMPKSFPRPCGGDPITTLHAVFPCCFSPPMRG